MQVYSFGRSAAEFKPAFDALRKKTIAALQVDIYLVDMGGGAVPATLGADALSKYVTAGGSANGTAFETAIAAPERAWWKKQVWMFEALPCRRAVFRT